MASLEKGDAMNTQQLSQLLFRAAVIVTVPVVLLLCAVLWTLAQFGRSDG